MPSSASVLHAEHWSDDPSTPGRGTGASPPGADDEAQKAFTAASVQAICLRLCSVLNFFQHGLAVKALQTSSTGANTHEIHISPA